MPYVNVNCLVHILQWAIATRLKASSHEPVVRKCRKIVGHFKHSPVQNAKLARSCDELNLKHVNLVQDVITRWFSCLISQKDVILQVLVQGKKFNVTLSDSDFSRLRNLVDMLMPIKAISDFMGGDQYVTESCTMHVKRCIDNVMKITDEDAWYVVLFKRVFSEYMERISCTDVLLMAAATDPRMKKLCFHSRGQDLLK